MLIFYFKTYEDYFKYLTAQFHNFLVSDISEVDLEILFSQINRVIASISISQLIKT